MRAAARDRRQEPLARSARIRCVTHWDSIDALEALAGQDLREAVVEAEEEHLLTEVFCDHYEAIETALPLA